MESPEVAVAKSLAPTKRPRFFYGWIIVAVCSIGDLVSFGAGNSSLGAFLRPMSESLGWSRTMLSGAATLQSIANIVVAPILGPLVDRQDPRIIMLTGATVAAISYNIMGNISEPWQFYILYMCATALGLQGNGGFVTTAIVSKWFIRMRGRALAFSSQGNQLGIIIILPIVSYFIENFGWRAAWGYLGLVIAVVLMPPIAIFMRRMPEDVGLRPDGDPPESPGSGESAAARALRAEPNWGVKDALRIRTTWMLVIATNMWSIVGSAFLVHQMPYLLDAGLTLQTASFILVFHNAVTFFSKFFWGFAAERWPTRYCLAACYALRATGIVLLLAGSGMGSIYAYAVVAGMGISFAPLSAKIWADYYGRRSVASIRGAVAPFNIFSSLGGALFAGVAFDLTGSYTGAFALFALALYFGGTMVFLAKPPVMPAAAAR